jgi:hypothetical protein
LKLDAVVINDGLHGRGDHHHLFCLHHGHRGHHHVLRHHDGRSDRCQCLQSSG